MWYFLALIYDGDSNEHVCGPLCNPFGFGKSIFPMNNNQQKML